MIFFTRWSCVCSVHMFLLYCNYHEDMDKKIPHGFWLFCWNMPSIYAGIIQRATFKTSHTGDTESWRVLIVAPMPKMQQKTTPGNTLIIKNLPHCKTPYSPWTCPTAKHPTHRGPASLENTLLTTACPTAEHPTHCWPAPPQNTLLTLDL